MVGFSSDTSLAFYHADQTKSMSNALKKFAWIEKLLNDQIGAKRNEDESIGLKKGEKKYSMQC